MRPFERRRAWDDINRDGDALMDFEMLTDHLKLETKPKLSLPQPQNYMNPQKVSDFSEMMSGHL